MFRRAIHKQYTPVLSANPQAQRSVAYKRSGPPARLRQPGLGPKEQRHGKDDQGPRLAVPRFFAFQNKDLEPEERAQRVLNKNRVPAIKEYLLQNVDGYVFSSITASYQLPEGTNEEDLFQPISEGSNIGILNLPMEADRHSDAPEDDGEWRRERFARLVSSSKEA